jgi:hypothetical protein
LRREYLVHFIPPSTVTGRGFACIADDVFTDATDPASDLVRSRVRVVEATGVDGRPSNAGVGAAVVALLDRLLHGAHVPDITRRRSRLREAE